MKKKLKLILFLVLIGGIGILLILSTWLYGSYNQRMELFLATAEHSLFDAVQEVMQQHQMTDTIGMHHPRLPKSKMQTELVTKIVTKFPAVPRDYLDTLMDSLHREEVRRLSFSRKLSEGAEHNRIPTMRTFRTSAGPDGRSKMLFEGRSGPGMLLPFFLFVRDSLDQQALNQIRTIFQENLVAKGIDTGYDFKIVTQSENRVSNDSPPAALILADLPDRRNLSVVGFSIRPLLIDPEKGKFITVDFSNPWQFLLYSLSWQLTISLVILLTIIGSFIYLFQTLLKQNRLDLLRKAFVNNLTHELRTPVTTVSVALQAIEGSVGNARERATYHSIAIEELNHLSDMIDKVLQISEDDVLVDRQLVMKEYDLIALIHKCIASTRLNSIDREVNFLFSPASERKLLVGDSHHMKNVIVNLMENAIKYGATQVRVLLEERKDRRYISLSIQDNGIGIPSAYHAQVFEPFFRVPQGDLYSVKGFGLGLAYVQQIMQQHGGSIKLKSVPNEGSIFIVTVPKS